MKEYSIEAVTVGVQRELAGKINTIIVMKTYK
jgi:hypothetical protein